MRDRYIWNLPRTPLELGNRTIIMGVLNVTPDSFSDGGQFLDPEQASLRGQQIEEQGADILDIGGESSRPGSEPVGEEEETRRILPVIEQLAPRLRIPISVDTYRSSVAKRAIEAGAQVVNDISGLRFDPALAEVVQTTGAGVVLMHSRGSRAEIHRQVSTEDPVQTVLDGLEESLQAARRAAITHPSIVVDPGIGFSKDASVSFKILKSLHLFSKLRYPLLVGTSRKSFIRAIIQDSPESRLLGTAATIASAIVAGAHIVRVHDVPQMRIVSDVIDRMLMA
jgi:dihydropteroate synthase